MSSEEELLKLADIALLNEEFEKAGEILTAILKANPGNLKAWILAAEAVDDLSLKIEYYENAQKIDPESDWIPDKLASLNFMREQSEKDVDGEEAQEADDPTSESALTAKSEKNISVLLMAFNTILLLLLLGWMGFFTWKSLSFEFQVREWMQEFGKQVSSPAPLIVENTQPAETTSRTAEESTVPNQPAVKPTARPVAQGERDVKPPSTLLPTRDDSLAASDAENGIITSFLPPEDELFEAVKTESPWKLLETPFVITDAVVAYGGRYVVLKLENFEGLVIYDAVEHKFIDTLRLASENFIYTAGGAMVVVYYPANNLLQTWSLQNFKKIKTKINPKGVTVLNLVMGHSNSAKALMRYAEGTNALDNAHLTLLDTINLVEIPLEIEKNTRSGRGTNFRDYTHYRSDAYLRFFTEWSTTSSPGGVGRYLITGNQLSYEYDHDSEGYLLMGDDGYIYTGTGKILNTGLTQVGEVRERSLLPGVGGQTVLGIGKGGNLQIYTSGSTAPITSVGQLPDYPEEDSNSRNQSWSKTHFTQDRHTVFSPAHEYILYIPPKSKKIYRRKFNLKEILEKSEQDYLVVVTNPNTFVRPGQQWQYQIDALSSDSTVSYSLEFAPAGMIISPTGLISWTVPLLSVRSTEKVVVYIETENGEAVYHNFELNLPTN